jgi:hypothetical protein
MGISSALVYLIPVVALVVARSRRERSAWEVALDVPSAVAADVLLVLLLSRVVHLETAAFVARGIELVLLGVWLFHRKRHGDTWAWPRALGGKALFTVACSAAAACALSMLLSRKYHIWDRYWHVNLVTSIRGQRLPFANVYDSTGPLSYHYSGDALAAMLQSFSLGSLHSSFALSLAHDILFSLTGATLGLLFLAWGSRGAGTATLATLGWLLAGPPALLRDDGKQFAGYNFVNYLTLSFRPHVVLAGLLSIGFLSAFLLRVKEASSVEDARSKWHVTVVPLLLTTAAMAVTDEASCALLGLGLGVAWLVWPRSLGLDRWRGLGLLLGLAAAVVIANLVFAGLLSPGAARPPISMVGWRSPGFANPTLPFSAPNGKAMFFADVAAVLAFALGAVWLSLSSFKRPVLATAGFLLTLVAVGCFALGRLDIPPKAVEAHRFLTAPMLACPFFFLFWLFDSETSGKVPLLVALGLTGLALPAASTIAWLRSPGDTGFMVGKSFFTTEDFYKTDCRSELGARLGERPRVTYLEQSVFFVYSGCHPVFTAGADSGGHRIKTSRALQGSEAFVDLNRNQLRPGQSLDVICPAGPSFDPICRRAKQESCSSVGKTRLGTGIVRCVLGPSVLAELMQAEARKGPKK